MKKTVLSAILLCSALLAKAQSDQIVKTGYNFGALPAVAFDADKGFQYGAILQIYNYGDGHNYPNYDHYTYFEYSRFTKGSQLIQVQHDNKVLIPGIRWSSSVRISLDKAFDFYGYNGYQSYYAYDMVEKGKAGEMFRFTPFYRMKKNEFSFKSDLLGTITDKLRWEFGIFARYYQMGEIDYANVNKGKKESAIFPETMPTLYGIYKKYGIISSDEADGGLSSGLRAGMVYDSRDKEGAPTRGIWAEGHVTASLPYISTIPFYRYSFTWRHYLPIVTNDKLTFAYRLNYEGNIGKSAPFYAIPYMTAMGSNCDYDGMGGYRTARGIMRSRVVGLDMMAYNLELRWRPVSFKMINQNFAIGLSMFSDGCMATRSLDISPLRLVSATPVPVCAQDKDSLHATVGAGLRIIMNENFIVAAEYGTPFSHFKKDSPLYNQDGTGALYINIGYLF